VKRRMVRAKLSAYYTKTLIKVGSASHGGSIFPPNVDVETEATVRCPAQKREFITAAACRLLAQTQFGQDQLLFHGTADPDAPVFPSDEQDNLRWYAFGADMSLDFIREEVGLRRKANRESTATLHVYRLKKPIRNLLLFADANQWAALGGSEKHLVRDLCGVPKDPELMPTLRKRAFALGAPLEEYLRARGVQNYRIVRGTRGEHANGWVRVNAIGVYEGAKLTSKGFELLLTCPDHEEYLELVQSFDVVDDADKFGVVSDPRTTDEGDMLWFTSVLSPSPAAPVRVRRRMSEGGAGGDGAPSPTRRRISLG
jgi:hypothetical protein